MLKKSLLILSVNLITFNSTYCSDESKSAVVKVPTTIGVDSFANEIIRACGISTPVPNRKLRHMRYVATKINKRWVRENFTDAEIAEITAFKSSPAGQKYKLHADAIVDSAKKFFFADPSVKLIVKRLEKTISTNSTSDANPQGLDYNSWINAPATTIMEPRSFALLLNQVYKVLAPTAGSPFSSDDLSTMDQIGTKVLTEVATEFLSESEIADIVKYRNSASCRKHDLIVSNIRAAAGAAIISHPQFKGIFEGVDPRLIKAITSND